MYFDDWGLLNSKKDEVYAENSILWTLQYVLLCEMCGKDVTIHKNRLYTALKYCEIKEGIYSQNPTYTNNPNIRLKEQYMSPDQYIVFMASYKLWGWRFGKEMWKETLNQYLCYDNVNPDTSPNFNNLRVFNPKHLAFAAYCNGSLLCPFLLPFLIVGAVVSCMSPKDVTSGKLITWTYLTTIKWTWFTKLCTKLIEKKHGSWANVFEIYFPFEDHPSNVLSKKVYSVKDDN